MTNIPWWRTYIGEEEIRDIAEAINNEHISHGPIADSFADEIAKILGVPYVIATTSGSMALVLALMTLEVGPGDEVIVPNRTFIATAHAALLLGARVVLVDTLPDLPIIDAAQIEQKITSRTKAIIAVHLNGRIADMERVTSIAKRHNLAVVEDSAQAFFSRNRLGFAGTLGDIGTYSLGMAKLISTGQGGMVAVKDKKLYEKMKLIQGHGVERGRTHDSDYTMRGGNFKFTDIQAAMGMVQLKRLPEKVARVTEIYQTYKSALKELPFLEMVPVKTEEGEVPLWAEVLCDKRESLMEFLAESGIQTDRFLPNLNLSPHLGNRGDFPNSVKFHHQGLALPCGPAQPMENVKRVINELQHFSG